MRFGIIAQFNIGFMYKKLGGVPKNDKKAKVWYKESKDCCVKGIEFGVVIKAALNDMLVNADGTESNLSKSVKESYLICIKEHRAYERFKKR
jgi:hypothetical protein